MFLKAKTILSLAVATASVLFSTSSVFARDFRIIPINPINSVIHINPFSNQNVFLGSTWLNFDRDADVVRVPHICGVTNIQLTVRNNDAQIDYFLVRFGNGEVQTLNVRDYFRRGSSSRLIDLDGRARCIDEIFVQGRTRTNGSPAQLMFTGFRLDQPPPVDNSIFLGSTNLEFDRDADVIRVPHICGLTNIQLTVRNNDAQIDYFLVRFGNGEVQTLNVRDYFRRGSSSRLIDLDGRARCIDEIFVQGRTRTNGSRAQLIFTGFSL